ncbi:hypothetical protein LPJ59_000216 [Coemansia sp. RSA 2399]|nr:hypothetical protein LPJ59_000216 [Coemansia sp. RSA 2399]
MFRNLQLPATRAIQGVRRSHTRIALAHRTPWTESTKHQLLTLIDSAKRQGAATEDWDRVANYVQSIKPNTRKPWTPAESEQLAQYVHREFQMHERRRDWNQVGDHFGRTAMSCAVHYYGSWRRKEMGLREANDDLDFKVRIMATELVVSKRERSSNWSNDEIDRLIEACETNVNGKVCDWDRVAYHVGTDRTSLECTRMWRSLRANQNKKAAHKCREGSDQEPENAAWTKEEIAQMEAFAIKPFPPNSAAIRKAAALALFAHKNPTQVCIRLSRITFKLDQRKMRVKVTKSRPVIRQMVDSAQQGDVDWKAISVAVGLPELKCRQVYDDMEQTRLGIRGWTKAETDRLIASLAELKEKGKRYDWYAVAHAVGTRTIGQCHTKFCYDVRVKQALQ